MTSTLNPYLGFAGNAREAMEFYREVFGGTLAVNTYGEYGQAGTPNENLIMHALLQTPAGFTLMGSDSPDADGPDVHSSISISLSGSDEAELRGYWDKLAVDANIAVPLERQMWGDVFGMCTDKYGTGWMVNITAQSD